MENLQIKVIIFDFDGVIVDSMDLKGWCFINTFKDEYPLSKLTRLADYHFEHRGKTRYDKIRYLFNEILKKEIGDSEVKRYSERFSELVKENMDKKYLINEVVEFVKNNYLGYDFYIASASKEDELRELCKNFGIDEYFKGIYGLPRSKSVIVNGIIEDNGYKREDVVLIGDSQVDLEAAEKNKIRFYGYNNPDLKGSGTYLEKIVDLIGSKSADS